ncbi:hypothetical protein ILUMI_06635, partial [Ignelater luminosus]
MNRKVLGHLIQDVVLLLKQELPFRRHREDSSSINKGNYLESLHYTAQEEQFLRDHLTSSSTFKGTSSDIQNELIKTVKCVLDDERIKNELEENLFVFVQANKTLDVSCKSHMSLIRRYCVKDRVEERFIGFVFKDKTAKGLSNVIINVLTEWNVINKIVSQIIDGAAVMAGHQEVRLLICDLASFNTFFNKSSKRTALLTEKGSKLPQACRTRWNFHSKAVSTIKTYFPELDAVFESIIEDENSEWDPDATSCTVGLKRRLDDKTFVYFVSLYSKIFTFVDHLFNILQSKTLSNISTCQKEIAVVIKNLKNLRKEETVTDCIATSIQLSPRLLYNESALRRLTYEILDSQTVQLETRFNDFPELQLVDLLNENLFQSYTKKFPTVKMQQLKKHILKHLPPLKLLKCLVDNGLDLVYEEVTKLLRLILTLPVTTVSSERSM